MFRCFKKVVLVSVLLMMGMLAVSAQASDERSVIPETWQWPNLPADWWRQLPTDDDKLLKQRVDWLLQQLDQSRSILIAQQVTDWQNILESIHTSANAYQELVSKKGVMPAAKAGAVLTNYSLSIWLDALRDLRKRQQSLQQLQERNQQVSEQTAAVSKQADDVTAAYLAALSTDQQWPFLLSMVEQRLAWLVADQSLRLARENVNQAKTDLEQQQVQWQLVNDHLTVDDKDAKQLQVQLDQTKKQREKAIDQLRAAQAQAVLMWGDDELSRAKANWQESYALQQGLLLSVLESKVLWLERLLAYVQAHAQSDFNWETQLRDRLLTWQQQADHLDQQRKQARGKVEILREQAQASLIALSEQTDSKLVQVSKPLYQQSIKVLADSQTNVKTLEGQLKDLQTLAELEQHLLLSHDGVWRNRWHLGVALVGTLWQDVVDLVTATLFKVGDTPVTLLGLLRVVLFITAAWWVSFWLRKAMTQVAKVNDKVSSHTAYTLSRLIHYLIMMLGVVIALSSIGIDFSSLAWIAGALSVGIGFGLQDVVKNFVAGLIVMFEKTLKVGDYIELPSGISGTVKEISLRSTLINTGDNLEVVVPNGEFTSGRVVNWTLSDLYRRVHVPFSVSLQSDKKSVVDAVLAAAQKVPYTVDESNREPQVVLQSLDGKMSFELLVWIKQGAVKHSYGVKASYLWQIESQLREKGIELV